MTTDQHTFKKQKFLNNVQSIFLWAMQPVFRIRIHLIRIRHFMLNTEPDPGF
jgi:hypothetical protein